MFSVKVYALYGYARMMMLTFHSVCVGSQKWKRVGEGKNFKENLSVINIVIEFKSVKSLL